MVLNLRRRLLFTAGGAIGTLMLVYLASSLGPAGIFISLFIPLPVAFVVLRSGVLPGLGAIVLAVAGLLAAQETAGVASYLLQFSLGSLLLPLLLRRGWPWDKALATSIITVVMVAAAAILGFALWRGLSVQALMTEYIQGEVKQALALYSEPDLTTAQLAEYRQIVQRTGEFLVQAYPGLALVMAGFIQGLTLLGLVALGRGRLLLAGPSFRQWRAPESLIWLLIAGGFGTFLVNGWPARLAINLLTVLLPVYFLQGLAVVSFFFARNGISPLFRAVGYLLLTVLNPLPLIVTGIGVFDLWANFRKPRIKKT